jgi:hypothetical protein
MSLRNRARSLQKKTGLTYQQALARLRALGERPATLRRQTGWPLGVCDRYLVDGHAPIDVVEVPPADDVPIEVADSDALDDRIRGLCEALRSRSGARAVALVDLGGRVLVRVGHAGDDGEDVHERLVKRQDTGGQLVVNIRGDGAVFIETDKIPDDALVDRVKQELKKSRPVHLRADAKSVTYRTVRKVLEKLHEAGAENVGMVSYAMIATQAKLLVWFHFDHTDYRWVRRCALPAAGEIERLLDADESPEMPPAGGGGGTGGIPNEMRVVEPVPEERPKPKPTPIGRRRKRER